MRWTNRGSLVLAALAVASTATAQQPPSQQQFQQVPQQQPQRTQLEVIATVNGDAITKPEFEANLQSRMAALQKQAQQQGQPVAPASVTQAQQQTLDALIESRMVEQYVTENGPAVEDEDVKSVVDQTRQQLAAQQVDFNQFLATRGLTEKSFRKRIEGSIAWQKYQQDQLTQENLQKFVQENSEKFQADSLEGLEQQQVVQAYTASIWKDIVRQMKPKAEVEVVKKPGGLQSPQQPQQQPITPGQAPQ